jgi:HD-like signal output (HDOD) protein
MTRNRKGHIDMLAKLRKLLFPKPAKGQTATGLLAASGGNAAPSNAAKNAATKLVEELDTAFYGYLLGVHSALDCELNSFEQEALRKLRQLLKEDTSHSGLVPRLPAIIPRVMNSLRSDKSSTASLAAEIGRDPVLVGEVIRLSNSAYYRVSQETTSLERAIFRLGRDGVRQLVANAALRPLLNQKSGHFTSLSGTVLWQQSEKTAIACDYLAKQGKADRFHAYLAGIVQNVGFSVALSVLDSTFTGKDAPRSEYFREQFITASRTISSLIAKQWEFPKPVVRALEAQVRSAKVEQTQALDNILYMADKLAKMRVLSGLGLWESGIDPIVCQMKSGLTYDCTACYAALADRESLGSQRS